MIHHDILKFVHKSLNGPSHSHFHNHFQLSNTVHSHGTRQVARRDIFQPIRNTIFYGLRSMKYFGAKLWNGIPTFIKMSVSSKGGFPIVQIWSCDRATSRLSMRSLFQ